VLKKLKRSDEALASYDRAIALKADHVEAYFYRGNVLHELRQYEAAVASFDKAIEFTPAGSLPYLAYFGRAFALLQLKRLNEALVSFEQALALKGDYVEAYMNCGSLLLELGRHAAALAMYDKAIALKSDYVEAFQGRGFALLGCREHEAAIASFDRALALQPDLKYLRGFRRYAQMQICDWDDLAQYIERLTESLQSGIPVSAPFQVLALVDSAPLHRLAAEVWVREQYPTDNSLGEIAPRPRRDKIRVGYFSSDFRIHPVSLLTAELFETHDRSRFEITAFAFGPAARDAMRTRLERTFDRFVDVSAKSDMQVALLAREYGIDIAVDLGGFTEHARAAIFALRAAPIQMSYIGYLGTLGAPFMDYLVADATIIPADARQHYSEKIMYVPSYQVNDSQCSAAERMFTREELGLPPAGFVFACFNTSYKIAPSMFTVWMRILRRVEGSCLFLCAGNAAAERNLVKEAERRGVDSHRIVFGSHLALPEYLARFSTMDLFLDTLPYNAGTTASDALC
jgi:predicted O-linked N-acetylglucosamine transferase (SPINDLY family)